MNEKIVTLIKKYQDLYFRLLEKRLMESVISQENFVTQTNLVSNDFFDNESTFSCNDELKYRDFGETFIIFNDLKGSTEILRKCENLNNICLYTGYIFYSSKLLAEILDLLGGKIVEITGDGNYSIIQKKDFNEEMLLNITDNFYCFKSYFFRRLDILYCLEEFSKKFQLDMDDLKEYGILTGLDNIEFNIAHDLRTFFYCIFAIFNIGINKKLKSLSYDIEFATRVGCKFGNCKITRFEIDGHIRLDKLIGTIVNEAAHQATGK